MLRVKSQRNVTFGLAMLVCLGAIATMTLAQQQATPLLVMPLKGGLYWTQGGVGGNTGFIAGTNGVIVVDTKTTVDSSKEVQAEIAKITPKPVTVAIVTHSDGDHVNGLAAFPATLTTIIAQENCKKEMEASAGSRNPAPQDRLPNKTIDKDETLTLEGVRVRLLHFAPAHTSGDLIVYFPEQKVAFTGDIITTVRPEPLIHTEKNGTAAGWIENAKGLVALNADTYVTGHGDLQTKADVQRRLDVVQAKWDKIKAMVAQGKSLDDIKTSLGESTAPAAPGANGQLPAPTFTEIIYKEQTKKS
jgi:cyclase